MSVPILCAALSTLLNPLSAKNAALGFAYFVDLHARRFSRISDCVRASWIVVARASQTGASVWCGYCLVTGVGPGTWGDCTCRRGNFHDSYLMNLQTLYSAQALSQKMSGLWYVDSDNERASLGSVPAELPDHLPKGEWLSRLRLVFLFIPPYTRLARAGRWVGCQLR